MTEQIKYGNTMVSSRADQTLTYTKYVRDEATGKSAQEQIEDIHKDFSETKENAEKATANANKQAAISEELNSHPNIIKDGYWWTWDFNTHKYTKTGQVAVGTVDFPTFFIDEEEKTLKANITYGTDADRFALDEDGSLRIKMNYRLID